jgi:hypothetical protein
MNVFHKSLTIFISVMCFIKATQKKSEIVEYVYSMPSLIKVNTIAA